MCGADFEESVGFATLSTDGDDIARYKCGTLCSGMFGKFYIQRSSQCIEKCGQMDSELHWNLMRYGK